MVPVLLAAGLILAGAVLTCMLLAWPGRVPWSGYGPLIVVAGLFLSPRLLVVVALTYAAEMGLAVATVEWNLAQIGAAISVALITLVMLWLARSKARLGVAGIGGENMLVDLRDRLRSYAEFPPLPRTWNAETSVESAYGDKFSGDFAVTARSTDGETLDIVLVDVSGKGAKAGTRALLLSGALGGLIGEMDADRLLPAANAYLLRQDWSEGFATAIHVSMSLVTGDYTLGAAGHPRAVHFKSGSGQWEVQSEGAGPLLGVIRGAQYPRTVGTLARGDALVLYTDGVVESRDHDLSSGLDRMLGAGEHLVARGFAGGAQRLCAMAKAGETDDRAVVLIWRD